MSMEELPSPVKQPPMLRVITGGKGPPEAPKIDWLSEFVKGQWFLCKSKDNPVDVRIYVVYFRFEKARTLYSPQTGKHIIDPVEFCKLNELYEVLDIEDIEDGNSTEVRPADVVSNEDGEG